MFIEYLISAATQVSILYVMVFIGFMCDKTGLYSEKTARSTVNFLLYIIVPCTLINSFIKIEMNEDTVRKFFISFAVATATHIIGILLNIPFFRKSKHENNAVYKFASIYGNVGFMALPLAQAVLGAEGVFYCTNGVVVYNIINFIHGAAVMRREKEKFNLKSLLVNPGIISLAVGLPIFLLKINVPVIFSQPIAMLSNLNSPLAMLIFGCYLAHTDLKSMLFDKKIYLTAFLKLILLPLVCIGAYYLCGVRGVLLTASIITACVPSANNTFMFASKYGRDASLASKTVALVSFISIITMPFMIALTQII